MRRPQLMILLLVALWALAAGTPSAAAEPPAPKDGEQRSSKRARAAKSDLAPLAVAALEIPMPPAGGSAPSAAPTAAPMGLEVSDFRQSEPGDGDPASENTRAYISHDQENLYVLFVCEDDPRQVRANVVPRERITDDDRVGVYLDTYDDNQRAYAFLVNPLGIQRDGILTEGQDDDWTYDALWYSEGRLTEDGYVVRMRIPFGSLRFANRESQTWGIGLVRYIERKSEKSYWPYITERVEGFVNQLGSAKGLDRISPGRRFMFVPYTAAMGARFLDSEQDVPSFEELGEARIGLDVKVVPHDNVTMDVAIKPDFSQIQPDDPQVTVNERFEVRVPEQRPFFLENAGFFVTPEELFFSRRIVDPSGGARLTSKVGPLAVGALVMDDRAPGHVPADDPLYGERAYAGVFRVQSELPWQSTLGVLASDRELADGFNRVYAADTRIKMGKHWVATGQAMQSQSRNEEDGDFAGSGGVFELKRSGRFFDCSVDYKEFSPGFAADLGFVRRVGYREVATSADYTFRPKKQLVTAWGPGADVSWNWDWDGRLQDAEVVGQFEVNLPANTKFAARWTEAFELFEDQEFRIHEGRLDAETQWLKWLSLTASYQRGTNVNHDPPRKTAPFVAMTQETDVSVSVRPTSQFEFKQSATYAWMRKGEELPGLGQVIRPVFSNWILTSKLKYQVSRELSFRAIANYDAVVPNPVLSREDETRMLLWDFLGTYLVNPWTALYVGYSERYENVQLVSGEIVPDPFSSNEFRFPSTPVDRQFFVKLSYLVSF